MEKQVCSFSIPEGYKAGDVISITLTGKGEVSFNSIKPNSKILDFIDKMKNEPSHFIKNAKLFRRWILANYMKLYHSKWKYTKALENLYTYEYQFKVVEDELDVCYRLLNENEIETFKQRSHFFSNYRFINNFMTDYVKDLSRYWSGLRKNAILRTVNGTVISSDVDLDIIKEKALKICTSIYDIKETRREFKNFMDNYFIKLPLDTKKSFAWKNAYQAAGAYYSLRNLIMFHNCRIKMNDFYFNHSGYKNNEFMNMDDSIAILDKLTFEENYEGYQLHALLIKTMEDNNFDFYKEMKRKYKYR